MGLSLSRAPAKASGPLGGVSAQDANKRGKEKRKESPTDTDVQLPPLVILKDCGAQTEQTYPTRGKKSSLLINRLSVYALLALLVYGLLCLSVAKSELLQAILVFRHYPTLLSSPDELQDLPGLGLMQARNIQLTRSDGVLLRGWHLLPLVAGCGDKEALSLLANVSSSAAATADVYFDSEIARGTRPIVIYFHGNTANRALKYRIDMMKQLSITLDAHVIAFDYAGFGDSQGWPSEASTYADASSIYNWVEAAVARGGDLLRDKSTCQSWPIYRCSESQHTSSPRIIVYGHSLGSAIAVNLAVELNSNPHHNLAGIMLDAPFTSFPEAIKSHPNSVAFRIFPFTQSYILSNLKVRYDTKDKIDLIGDIPLLILHGTRDDKIPLAHSRQLYETAVAKSPKGRRLAISMAEIHGGNHINLFHHGSWTTNILNFYITHNEFRLK